jgi:homoserine O-acetyltransferase/O-succinyltransferase
MRHLATLTLCAVFLLVCLPVSAQDRIPLPDRKVFSLGDFRLESGQMRPGAFIAYATVGTLNPDGSNAILAPSYYGSDYHGYDFLIGTGKALDPAKHFIVLTEMFASGASSSPSNAKPPFDGPRFPAISVRDNVEASYRLLTTKLQVKHLQAVVGFSMGAQQAFQWAVTHRTLVVPRQVVEIRSRRS